MNGAGSVERGEYLRLFCALRLPSTATAELAAWQDAAFAGDGLRVVAEAHLHVTLAFLGRRPAAELDSVTAALRDAGAGVQPPALTVRRYRETRSVGMLVCDDEDGRAKRVAASLHERLERLGVYERERREWLPHVTVVRFRQRPGLQPELPHLGPIVTSEAAVYMSVLRPSGAQYEVLQSVALGEGS
jgi:RNA 2',3'-cyclic 3'-phosphodiesterase